MDSIVYTQEDNKLTVPEAHSQPKSPLPTRNKKRFLFWGIIGVLFILVYTGGTYYVLFSNRASRTPVTQSQLPYSPTATPTVSLPTPTSVPTVTPAAVSTINWKSYINKKYGITLLYPENLILNFNKTEAGVDPFYIVLSYPDSSPSGKLTINVQDSSYIGQSELESRAIMNFNLFDFATKKRDLNITYNDTKVPNRNVSVLNTILFQGKQAYSFTVSGSYYDDRGYQVLNEEYTYLFTENGNYKMILSYPTGDSLLKKISESMTFSTL